MYNVHPRRPRNYTGYNHKSQRKKKQIFTTGSKPGHYNQIESHLLVIILTVPLGLLVGGLGKCLLPDGAGGVVVEVCEENVEDLRVPADWVALDALLDVLLSNVSASPREKRMIVDG
jgi:hypothetical protein